MHRSVTAELELPAGEYDVLMKVSASKDTGSLPVEDVVRNNAKKRPEKLSTIGLSYDLAHAKGFIKETSEERKARKAAQAKKKEKARKEMKDKLMKEKKKRVHNDNKEKRKLQAQKLKRIAKAKVKKAKKEAKDAAANAKINGDAKEQNGDLVVKKQAEQKSTQTDANLSKTEGVKIEVKVPTGSAEPEKASGAKDSTDDKVDDKQATQATPSARGESSVPAGPSTRSSEIQETGDKSSTSKEIKSGDKVIEIKSITIETKDAPTPPSDTTSKPTSPSKSTEPPAPIEDSDDSDLESILSDVSDISVGVIDDAIEAANVVPPPPPAPVKVEEEEEDEFEKDPWNAVVVVGLRVYSKESAVRLCVKRGKKWEEPEKKKKKGKRGGEDSEDSEDSDVDLIEVGEKKLDVDDSAADAAGLAVQEEVVTPMEEKDGNESSKGDQEQDGEDGSSVVIV